MGKFAGVAVVLIAGLVSTLVAGKLSSAWITASARHRFQAEAQRIHQELDSYFERLVGVMLLVREGAKSGTHSSREDWDRLVDTVPLRSDFPAVTFIGIAERIEIAERSARQARWKKEYGQGFEIHPDLPLQQRNPDLGDLTNVYLPLIYLNPNGGPFAALHPLHGLDLVAIPSGAELGAALAHKVRGALGRLPQSLYPAALVCPGVPPNAAPRVPVAVRMQWQDDSPPPSQRLGTLICAVDMAKFFAGAFEGSAPDFGLRMFLTLPGGGLPVPIYSTRQTWPDTAESSAPWLRTTETTMLYENRLRCEFWSTPKFDRANYRHAWWLVIGAGTGFTLLAAGFVGLQVRARLIQTKIAEQLGASNLQLAAAARERARLSRDLHDGTIQNLYALGLELGHARSLIAERPADADQELGRTLTTLQAAIMELRQFVLELEPEAWQGQSVHTALEALVARLRRTTPLQFHLAIAADSDELPAKFAIHVLQLVREGLSNALRHAGASNVWVTLERTDPEPLTPREWRLEIRDDGKGFDVALTSNGGRGLRSFRERATELGGRSEVRSATGSGTLVTVVFPSPAKP